MMFGPRGSFLRAPGKWCAEAWVFAVALGPVLYWWLLCIAMCLAGVTMFVAMDLVRGESPSHRLEQFVSAEVCAPRRAGHGCLCTAAGSDEVWVDDFCDVPRGPR